MTIQRCPLKKGAFGQAGWGIARGPTKEQKEQLSLTHTLHTNICAGTQTNTCAWTCTCRVHTQTHTHSQTKPVYCCLGAYCLQGDD